MISAVSANEMGSQWGREGWRAAANCSGSHSQEGFFPFRGPVDWWEQRQRAWERAKSSKGTLQGYRDVKQCHTREYVRAAPVSLKCALSQLFSASTHLATCWRLIRQQSPGPWDKLCVDFCLCSPHCLPLSCFVQAGLRACHIPRHQTGGQ